MTRRSDRLWNLSDDERARARRAYEESPGILEAEILAALGACQDTVDRVLETVREGARCDS